MRTDQIKRSLYYYEWLTHSYNGTTDSMCLDKTSEKITAFLTGIYEKQLNNTNYKDFIVPTLQGDEFLIVDSKDDKEIRFRIVLCRENALPYIENDGELKKLSEVISNDQNIAEVTHCVFFVKYGILGAEYNFNGARATTVAYYMDKISESYSMPVCRAKLNLDVYSKLIKDESFTLFDFSVRTNSEAYNNVLANKSIFSAIQTSVPESDTIEVVIKRRKTLKNKRTGFSLPISFEEIKDLLTNYHEDIKRFNVSQGKMNDTVDLLADKFVGRITLAKTSDRAINSEEMYQAISDYFANSVETSCDKLED